MKFVRKRPGSDFSVLPKIIHSPAEYASDAFPLRITAAVREGEGEENGQVPDRLSLYIKDRDMRIDMLPCDGLERGDISYEIYGADIPADILASSGGRIEYAVAEDGVFSDITDLYAVDVIASRDLPSPPPLILTEMYARPKKPGVTAYFEVANPGTSPVDLYGYEMTVYVDKSTPGGKPDFRRPLAGEPGTLLAPGEYAAIWWLRPANYGTDAGDCVTVSDFIRVFNSDFANRFARIGEDARRIIPVDCTAVGEDGKRRMMPGCGEMAVKMHPACLGILPRGGTPGDEFYTALYSGVYGSWDTPVRQSSYWTYDPRHPSAGVCIAHSAPATPGAPGYGQRTLSLASQPPLVIPVRPVRHIYTGDGDIDLAFAVVPADESEGGSFSAYVTYKNSAGEDVRLRAEEGDDGLFHALVPVREADLLGDRGFSYSLTASDGIRTASYGSDVPVSVPVYRNGGPRITSMLPTEGYAYDGMREGQIAAEWEDAAGTDLSACALFVDGKDMTGAAEWTDGSVRLKLTLKPGSHRLSLVLTDTLGNLTGRDTAFSVSDMKELNIYRGEVHSHTMDSDGSGFPPDAFTYARDVGGVDFFAVTDHSHYIDGEKYARQIRNADRFNVPGRFAALYGFEMTWNNSCGYWGHINVLGTTDFVQNIKENDMPALFRWLEDRPGAVGMFNHPGYVWGNFDEYGEMTPGALRSMRLAEIRSAGYDPEYMYMLAKGWHAAPVSNEDNHLPDWTTATGYDGCVLAPALTRENVLDAFRAGRTYTTSDRTMKIFYRVNGEWLGSTLESPSELRFDISVTTEQADGIGRVEIVAEDGITVAVRDASGVRELHWTPVLEPEFDYYYVRITGPARYCVTAPVWIENRERLAIEGFELGASYNPRDTQAVSVYVSNSGDTAVKDLRISFCLSGRNGFRRGDIEPFATVHAGRLPAGGRIKASVLMPELPGLRRVTVFARGERGGKKCRSTGFAVLSSLRIAEVLPSTSPFEPVCEGAKKVKNPFPYITLYNSSNVEADLSGWDIGEVVSSGKTADDAHTMKLDGIRIAPRSSLVIWDRHGSDLTVSDFNARYGTSLEEGKDIVVATARLLNEGADGRRLVLRQGTEAVCRANWNCFLRNDRLDHTDEARRYVYIPNMTGIMTETGYVAPRPGYVDEEQSGAVRAVLPGRHEKKRAEKADRKDRKAEEHSRKARLTAAEGTAAAVGSAAAAAVIAAGIGKLIKRGIFRK